MNEKTLVIIKPDGLKNCSNIISILYNNDLKVTKFEVKELDKDVLRQHYSHLLDRPFYGALEEYMLSAPVAIMVVEGDNAVLKLRELAGKTDSRLAKEGTIRNLYGTDEMRNAIHTSDSNESAKEEINRFFPSKTKKLIPNN